MIFGLAAGFYDYIEYVLKKQPSAWLTARIAVTSTLAFACSIVSGAFLIKSLVTIRQFFKEKGGLDNLRTSTMVKHAVAFGFYMVCLVAFNIAAIAYNVTISEKALQWAICFGVLNSIG